MPKVRLSGTVRGTDDPGRAVRARLLYLLFGSGWDIYNSNGDQRITREEFVNGAVKRLRDNPERFAEIARPFLHAALAVAAWRCCSRSSGCC